MIKSAKVKQALVQLIIAFLISLFASHYLEYYETQLILPFRNLLYFGEISSIENSSGLPETYYEFSEKPVVNPVHVAQSANAEALAILQNQLTIDDIGFSNAKHKILMAANQLVDILEITRSNNQMFGRWPYEFEYPYYNLEPPWYSGMAQGLGIEVLLAAYVVSGEGEYLDAAILAGKAMEIEVRNGGVSTKVANDALWFEEYASANAEPPYVLNGHIFALEGLWYLKGYSPEFQSTYEAGLQALKQLLPKFDRYVWSQYDLVGTPANPKYQRLHVRLLKELAQRDYDSLFIYYADKFERQIYMPFGLTYRLIYAPTTMMMGILILNSLLIFLVLSFSRRILSRG